MCVRHQDGFELVGLEEKPAPVALLEFLASLIETAIDENSGVAPLEVRAAPCH
jgi:hypothetical protein